ncbi:MAG: hypothetical protein ACRCZ2_02930 [Fusobacteriaceae bacterium]
MDKILICCINYNNSNEVLDYAKAISLQNKSEQVLLVITDNSNNQNEKSNLVSKIKEIELDIIIIDKKSNLGYLNGMFLGVTKYFDLNNSYPKWSIFSNTDIKFKNNHFIEDLINKEYEKKYWCIAPSVFSNQTKSYQNPHYKQRIQLSNINRVLFFTKYHILFNIYSLLSSLKSKKSKKVEADNQDVYAAHGCFFILRDSYFKSLKNLEYGAFLYSEEAFIAETILKENKKIYYDKTLKVIHTEHSTTNLIGNKNRAKFINESLRYIKKEFYEVENG